MGTSFKLDLDKGMIITGKWRRHRYRVERLLGEGANGKVYLVERERRLLALKVGLDTVDLQSEINVLQALEGQQRKGTGQTRSFMTLTTSGLSPARSFRSM